MTNPNAVLGKLTESFAAFKADHKSQLIDMRSEIDSLASKNAALQVNGGGAPASIGNRKDEFAALAGFARTGEVRADLSIGGTGGSDGTKGGFSVFPHVSDQIYVRTFEQSAMARLARIQDVADGSTFQEPQDLGQPGATWVGETDARPSTASADFALLNIALDELYINQSITQRLLDDSRYNLGAWLTERISDKFGRTTGAAYISGDGVQKPQGILTAPTSADDDATRAWGTVQTIPSGAAATITNPDALIDVVYSLKASYRAGATWVMNSKTASVIRKMKDSDGRFLWTDSLVMGQPASLLGYAVEIDENMPDIAASALPIMFGNFGRAYIILRRNGLRLLQDPYTARPSVLFYAYFRTGGALADSEAVKFLQIGT